MPVKRLAPVQKELILEWIGGMEMPFTVDDLAMRYEVHDQTARAWINQLKNEGLVTEHPMRRGRRVQYLRSSNKIMANGEAAYVDPDDVAIRVVHGADQLAVAEWAAANLGNNMIAQAAHMLAYLYVRSYYADVPEYQHLRGTTSPVEARAYLAELVQKTQKDLEVMRQLLAYNAPWIDNGEFARRFGMVEDLPGIMKRGEVSESVMQKWKESKRAD